MSGTVPNLANGINTESNKRIAHLPQEPTKGQKEQTYDTKTKTVQPDVFNSMNESTDGPKYRFISDETIGGKTFHSNEFGLNLDPNSSNSKFSKCAKCLKCCYVM